MSTTTEKWTIFGERLKTELDRQGMSLRQFSQKTGITLVTACRYVHSQRTPRATEILKAAKALGVTCDYMLGLTDDPRKTRDGWTKAGFHESQSQSNTEEICARIKQETIKHNKEYMKHGDRYMLGFVDGMRLARSIVDGTIDDPVYFTLSGEINDSSIQD